MLIHDVAERKKAASQRMLSLLNFLKEETYSDFKTLKKVVGYERSSLAAANRCVAECRYSEASLSQVI